MSLRDPRSPDAPDRACSRLLGLNHDGDTIRTILNDGFDFGSMDKI